MDSMLCNWHQYVETEYFTFRVQLRREKISERMKMLQSLVPGCDKVTGKALMLDEIISYVQSLQNQVEVLLYVTQIRIEIA